MQKFQFFLVVITISVHEAVNHRAKHVGKIRYFWFRIIRNGMILDKGTIGKMRRNLPAVDSMEFSTFPYDEEFLRKLRMNL